MPLIEDTQRYINPQSTSIHLTVLQKNEIRIHPKTTLNNYLVETDIAGVLTEALTAEVELVLADQSGSLAADTAKEEKKKERMINHCQSNM